ncbi:MAG: ABC transporter substrate-binding protein [Solirubrobacteraceae bacterium]
MRTYVRTGLAFAGTTLVVVALAACGSSSSSSSGSGGGTSSTTSVPLKPGENPVGQQLYGKKKGGVLTVYSNSDFQHLDPGSSYYSLDYSVIYATQSPLFAYLPDSTTQLGPLLASAMPSTANGGITDGGKTVTVHLRHGFKFSPPVNREVTSSDVAYGIERGANPNVTNAYFGGYLGSAGLAGVSLVGANSAKYTGGPIPGIQTPDKSTIVFHLTKADPLFLTQILSLPVSAPVPPEMAGPLDKKNPTTYGSTTEAFSGPYMIKSDSTGKFAGIGYQAGKSLSLVRNPNWNGAASGDPRPAYLDQINVNIGGSTDVIGPQVLKGSDSVQLDTPGQSVVKLAYQQYPAQITFTPGSGTHYGGLDTAHGPFTNVNLRRAVWANLDRAAIVKARGGPLVAQPMTHFIYPGVDGFNGAGGSPGPQVDFNKNVNGDATVAKKYMKLAGYPSGKYTGTATLQVVSGQGGNSPAISQIVNNDLTQLGFKTHLSLVDQATMYGKYCGVPKSNIDVCPSSGWIRDFADPLSVLLIPFYGPDIIPTNNSNWSQLNDPAINAAMQKAGTITDPTARTAAWAAIDTQLVNIAAGLPETFDNQPNIESKNVAGVNDLWNTGAWDFSFTSLK